MSIFSGCTSKLSKITKLENLNSKTLGTLALSNLTEVYLLDMFSTVYSISLLSKVSEIAKINFELVTVGVDTQKLELISSKTDYIFCFTLTDKRMETETELIFSDPYYSYSATVLLVKK